MSNFRAVDRGTAYLLPPSVDEWLPADHLARFVVEIVEQLDFSPLTQQYRGSGSEAYHPQMLAALMLYGYARGPIRAARSSRPATTRSPFVSLRPTPIRTMTPCAPFGADSWASCSACSCRCSRSRGR